MLVVPKDLKDKAAMTAESMELFLAAMKVYFWEIELVVGLEIFWVVWWVGLMVVEEVVSRGALSAEKLIELTEKKSVDLKDE
jgi:hypothetical protein